MISPIVREMFEPMISPIVREMFEPRISPTVREIFQPMISPIVREMFEPPHPRAPPRCVLTNKYDHRSWTKVGT